MQTFSQFTPNSKLINDLATTSIKVAERIMNNKPVTPNFQNLDSNTNKPFSTPKQLPQLTLKEVSQLKAPARFCPFKSSVKCDPQFPYRQIDGSCNNLDNLWWGQAEMPFKRFIDADYSDQFKLNDPRVSVDGSELPNARDLACNLHEDSEDIEPFISHIFMQWGQLINHDITSISSSRDDDPDKTVCNTCTKSSKCLPVRINQNASCACRKRMARDCIEFTRSSATFGDVSCTIGKREQLNLVTPWLDGSHIYGSNDAQLETLRDRVSGGKGLFAVQKKGTNSGKDMLPMQTTDKPSDCLDFTSSTKCFHAGDDRVNQNPSLMSMHTLFVREHNRIANILSNLNPIWEDEIVFQETRRIIIAMIQHITYNEFLPVLLGGKNMKKFSLSSLTGFESFTGYNKSLDPRIANEYSAAAGRFGHSMVRSEYSRVNSNFTSAGHTSFLLRNSYFRANGLYDECQGGLESIIRGMLKDPLMKIDRHFSSDLTQHLFEIRDKFGRPFHFDLVTINIMRGRDHGIPSYTKHRDFCGLPPIRTWTDMKQFISEDTVNILRQFYRFVDDVDLFVAGVSENKEDGSIVGPTFSCLLGLQFQQLKFGDRFWYETSDFPANFTPAQLNELRKQTLSKILCRTMQNTPMIQPLAMLTRQIDSNQLVSCDSFTDIDWNFWKSG